MKRDPSTTHSQMYRDGRATGLRRGGTVSAADTLRGIQDAEDMGWYKLADYFRGLLSTCAITTDQEATE